MFVYVIGPSAVGPVKIGHSADPTGRCADLQTGHPERLAVLLQVECGDHAPAIEAAVHVALSDHATDLTRVTEWFCVSAAEAERVILEQWEEVKANPPDMVDEVDLRTAPAPGCDRSPPSAIPFYEWLLWRPSYRDLADDLLSDPDRPKGGRSFWVLRDRLVAAGAPLNALLMLRHAWKEHVACRRLTGEELRHIAPGNVGLRVVNEPGFALLLRHGPEGEFAGAVLTRARWETAGELQAARDVRDRSLAAWLPSVIA